MKEINCGTCEINYEGAGCSAAERYGECYTGQYCLHQGTPMQQYGWKRSYSHYNYSLWQAKQELLLPVIVLTDEDFYV